MQDVPPLPKYPEVWRRVRPFLESSENVNAVALATGADKSTVNRWKNGRSAIPEEHWPAIEDTLALRPDELRELAGLGLGEVAALRAQVGHLERDLRKALRQIAALQARSEES